MFFSLGPSSTSQKEVRGKDSSTLSSLPLASAAGTGGRRPGSEIGLPPSTPELCARAAGTRKPGRRRGSPRGWSGRGRGRGGGGAKAGGGAAAGCAVGAASAALPGLRSLAGHPAGSCPRAQPPPPPPPPPPERARPRVARYRGDVNRGPRARPGRRDVAQARGGAAEERPEALGDPEEQLLLHPAAAPRARRRGRPPHR
jgi:hypothetical protein